MFDFGQGQHVEGSTMRGRWGGEVVRRFGDPKVDGQRAAVDNAARGTIGKGGHRRRATGRTRTLGSTVGTPGDVVHLMVDGGVRGRPETGPQEAVVRSVYGRRWGSWGMLTHGQGAHRRERSARRGAVRRGQGPRRGADRDEMRGKPRYRKGGKRDEYGVGASGAGTRAAGSGWAGGASERRRIGVRAGHGRASAELAEGDSRVAMSWNGSPLVDGRPEERREGGRPRDVEKGVLEAHRAARCGRGGVAVRRRAHAQKAQRVRRRLGGSGRGCAERSGSRRR